MSLSMPRKEYYWKNHEKCLEDDRKRRKSEERQAYLKQWWMDNRGRYKRSPKEETIHCWKQRGIVCDYDAIYDIYINTHKCDHCKKKFESSYYRCLDHCHTCGTVRGIICRSCNTGNKLKCYLC